MGLEKGGARTGDGGVAIHALVHVLSHAFLHPPPTHFKHTPTCTPPLPHADLMTARCRIRTLVHALLHPTATQFNTHPSAPLPSFTTHLMAARCRVHALVHALLQVHPLVCPVRAVVNTRLDGGNADNRQQQTMHLCAGRTGGRGEERLK